MRTPIPPNKSLQAIFRNSQTVGKITAKPLQRQTQNMHEKARGNFRVLFPSCLPCFSKLPLGTDEFIFFFGQIQAQGAAGVHKVVGVEMVF